MALTFSSMSLTALKPKSDLIRELSLGNQGTDNFIFKTQFMSGETDAGTGVRNRFPIFAVSSFGIVVIFVGNRAMVYKLCAAIADIRGPVQTVAAFFFGTGRAGRDGQKAYAVVLYAKSDKATLHKRIPDTFPEKEYIKEVYEHLQYYYQMAMGDGQGCVREFNIEDFCRKFKYFPVPVDSALKILTQAGYLEYTDEQDNASRLLFTIRRDELYKLRELGEDMDKLIQTILRSYTGVFTDHAFINEDSLAIRTGLTRRQVYEQLIHLAKLHIVSYIPRKKTPYIIYTRERVEMRHLQIPSTVYEERKERYEKRISAMLDYVSSDTVCRSRMLLHYFGEKNEHNCGQCDTCINLKNKKPSGHLSEKELSEKILQALSDKPQTPATLAEQIADAKNMLIDVLHGLLDEGKVIAVNGMLQIKK